MMKRQVLRIAVLLALLRTCPGRGNEAAGVGRPGAEIGPEPGEGASENSSAGTALSNDQPGRPEDRPPRSRTSCAGQMRHIGTHFGFRDAIGEAPLRANPSQIRHMCRIWGA